MRNRQGNIISFDGDERYLSNFATLEDSIYLDGMPFITVEAAYQAAKTFNHELRRAISCMSPGNAKKAGNAVKLRDDWEQVRVSIMKDLVHQKFEQEPFRSSLIQTHEHVVIIEGNHWGDIFWGMSGGIGANNLGKIIMEIRDDLKGVRDMPFDPQDVMRRRR